MPPVPAGRSNFTPDPPLVVVDAESSEVAADPVASLVPVSPPVVGLDPVSVKSGNVTPAVLAVASAPESVEHPSAAARTHRRAQVRMHARYRPRHAGVKRPRPRPRP